MRATSFDDVLQEAQSSQLKNELERKAVDRFVSRISKTVLLRLEKFDKAIDVIVQSTKIAALLWGSMRFMLTVSSPSILSPSVKLPPCTYCCDQQAA
jgi:hypothetical protein